ncbi:hypothetical protein LSH36_323g00028 [Paralvinella palmiformis]|uniref:SWIM-type domain-containing protein n=1 Tax=Paralvinella palmiformis TaxID=53620 RepID=A0AAD9JG95_9ANNE|nr:hypothetical protein LSH36_323g00028 [Paralvinella palmiformis]
MTVPDAVSYKDINSDTVVPGITVDKVMVYLELFGQEARKNAKEMYFAKFLRSIRINMVGNDVFILGRVSAEMIKNCIYKVDLKIDHMGVVQESHCECASGMGPEAHCKHVVLVMFALTKVKEGIITMETSTQQLQTFHQAKKNTRAHL